MKFLRVTLHEPPGVRHPVQQFIAGSSAIEREELWAWTMVPGDLDRLLFYVEGAMDRYDEFVAGVDSILEYDLTPAGERGFYAYVTSRPRDHDREFREAFVGRNLVIVPPVVFGPDGNTRLTIVGPPPALQGVVDDLPDPVVVDVERIGEYDHRHDRPASGLTDRQRTAVATAVGMGYYAVPRETTLAAVAEELGVAESTASDLLRRAEATVMRRTASGETDKESVGGG